MQQGKLLPVARGLIAVAVSTALLVACSGSGDSNDTPALGKDPLAAIATAMKDASGHITGSVTGPKGTSPGKVEGDWKGDLAGQLAVKVEFVDGSGTKVPAEIRVAGKKIFLGRTEMTLPANATLAVFTHAKGVKPWRAVFVGSAIVDALPAAFSPTALVEQLHTQKVPVKVGGTVDVGGTKATEVTTTRPTLAGVWSGVTVHLFVDADKQVVRVKLASEVGGLQYDVSGYGKTVSVAAPPAAQISSGNETPPIEPDGPFATVTSGTTNGVTWALQKAKGTQGTTCWRWQASAPLPQVALAKPDAPRCVKAPPAEPMDASELVQFVVMGNGQGSYDALAVVLPPDVASVTFGWVGGKTEKMRAGEPFVWVGPNQPTKGYLGVTFADGSLMECGAGAIGTAADLTDPKLTGPAAAAPWACFPPDTP